MLLKRFRHPGEIVSQDRGVVSEHEVVRSRSPDVTMVSFELRFLNSRVFLARDADSDQHTFGFQRACSLETNLGIYNPGELREQSNP
jgi:hypothetical protein